MKSPGFFYLNQNLQWYGIVFARKIRGILYFFCMIVNYSRSICIIKNHLFYIEKGEFLIDNWMNVNMKIMIGNTGYGVYFRFNKEFKWSEYQQQPHRVSTKRHHGERHCRNPEIPTRDAPGQVIRPTLEWYDQYPIKNNISLNTRQLGWHFQEHDIKNCNFCEISFPQYINL